MHNCYLYRMIGKDDERVAYIDTKAFMAIVTQYAEDDNRSRNELFQHVMRIFLKSKGIKID